MRDLAEFLRDRRTHLVRGRILALQVRETLLDGKVPPPQGVIFAIGYRRRIFRVVAVVVLGNLSRQTAKFLCRFCFAQFFYGNVCHGLSDAENTDSAGD